MPKLASSGGPTDQDLVEQAVGGNAEAFGVIVERYQDRLYNAAYRLVGSPEDARDVVQDSFVKAYEKLAGFRGRSALYTWLFRIVVNMSLSHRRKRRRVRFVSATPVRDEDDPAVDLPDRDVGDPSDALVAAETETLVQRALDGLDDEHRTVVVLRDIQHFDYEQIAGILEVPIGTVKSRLHRARLMLRDRLRPLLRNG